MIKPLIAILDNNDQLLCVTKDYFDSNLHTFLQGTAAFFSCSVLQKSEMAQHFKVGNKISFVHEDRAYHFDITDMVKNEDYVTIQSDTLTLELRNEDSDEYKATKAMTFEEYLKVFLFAPDNPLVMGINEVSDKKLQLEWEGSEESILARLFSLANKFDAEIEFVTKLNRHWGLEGIILNIFKANDTKHQGIGENRQDIILEYGNNVETIEIHENIDNLKTAIKPTGKDGLTIKDVVIDEKDEYGNQLFYSPKGDHVIRAVQARNQFRSKLGSDKEGYIAKNWSYETDNKNTLAGQSLAELKKLSKVELTVTIKAYEKLNIGDTVRAQNKAYQPTLDLSVRVSEQDIYFEEPSKNTTTITNVEILKSEVDTSLLARVQELIKVNKKYEYQIISDNGTVFKNNQGQTTLTARVLDGVKDVTDDLILSWSKDGKAIGSNKELIVNAAEITDKAVFRYDVADETGLVIGGYEVTVTNVNDGKEGSPGAQGKPGKDGESGKASVLHTAWATDAYGANISKYPPKPNLLPVTDFTSPWRLVNIANTTTATIEDGIVTLTKSDITATRPVFLIDMGSNRVELGKSYVTSIDVYITPGSSYPGDPGSIFYRNAAGTPQDISTATIPMAMVSGSWRRLEGVPVVPTLIGNNTSYFGIGLSTNFIGTMKFRLPKYEISEYATPFIKNINEATYEPSKYTFIGLYSDLLETQSMDPNKYDWNDIGGPDGADGKGTPGADGKDAVLHTAYAFSDDGKKWFSNRYPRTNLFRDYFVLKNTRIGKKDILDYTIREAWAEIFIPGSKIKELLSPNSTYSITYSFELLTRADNTTAFGQNAHGTLLLYNPTTGVSVPLGGTVGNSADAGTWVVGTKRTRTATFKTPADLTGWMILCYTMRSMNGSALVRLERGRFYDIKIEAGSDLTGVVTNTADSEYYSKPMFTGTYADYTEADSTNPDDYTWVQNRSDSRLHVAYANAEDKSDIITAWPRPNILLTQPGISSNDATNYPVSITSMTENGLTFRRVKRTSPEKNPGVLSIYNGMVIDPSKYAGKRLGISFFARADKKYTSQIMDYAQNPQNATQPNFDHYYQDEIGPDWKMFSTVFESWPEGYNVLRYLNFQLNGANAATSYIDYRDWKVEILEPGQEPTPYYPYGKEVAFKYIGTYTDTLLESSTDPTKYGWNPWKGDDGAPMFTWIAYANDSSGNGISLSSVGKRYIGIATNKLTETPILTPNLYTWSELGNQAALDALGNTVGNIPRIYTQSNTPTDAKNGDQWWVMSNNNVTDFKVYGNGSWYSQKMDQGIMTITQLNSVLINSATIVGPDISSPYDIKQGLDQLGRLFGTMTLKNGILSNEGMYSHNNVAKYTYETQLSLEQLSIVSYEGGSKAKPLGRVELSSKQLAMLDPDTLDYGLLTPKDLFRKGWTNITTDGKVQYSVIFGCAYIRFQSNYVMNGTGVVGKLPAHANPGYLQMHTIAVWHADPSVVDKIQINEDGTISKISNKSGGSSIRGLIPLGPIGL